MASSSTQFPPGLRGLLLACIALLPGQPAQAQAPSGPPPAQREGMGRPPGRTVDVPPGPLAEAVTRLAAQTGLQILFDAQLAAGRTSGGVRGSWPASEALGRLLAGTGLTYRMADDDVASLQLLQGAEAPVLLPTVDVVGSHGTERTGAYGSDIVSIGKSEQTLREIPQSVTVLSRQTLDDQNVTTVNEALSITPGVTLARNDDSNERAEIFIRGFAADSLQVDGVAISGNNDVMTFDTAIYDRIEVLRGPAGLLQGAGEPGGTINLVRKRPTDQWQALGEMQLGSWQRRRFVGDVSGPLVESGRVRGRTVVLHDEGNSFIDLVDTRRWLGYGALEADLSEQTTLTLGGVWQENAGRASRGLPAYADGRLLDVRRGTFIGPDWALGRTRSAEGFVNLEHRYGQGAVARVQGSYLNRWRNGRLAFPDSPVDPMTGDTTLLPELRIDTEENYNLDASTTIPFQVAGLRQSILLGTNYRHSRERLDRARTDELVQNVFYPEYDLPEPDFILDRFDQVLYEQYGAYGQARVKPVKWGTLVAGGRVSWWNTRSHDRESGEKLSSSRVAGEFTPYVGVIIDLSDSLSAYASYTDVFVPQAERTRDNTVLKPREGRQYEAGLKAEWLGGRLNGRAAVFQVEDTNRAVVDPEDDDFSVAAGKVRSRGFEVELVGEITPEWQVLGGYTYLTSEYLDDPANDGVTFEPRVPMHALRLWSKYRVRDGGLAGLSIAGGITAQSRTWRQEGDLRYTQGAYAVADLQVGYRFNETLQGRFTVNNVFDQKYYQSIGYADRQSYYGAPRAFLLSLSTAW